MIGVAAFLRLFQSGPVTPDAEVFRLLNFAALSALLVSRLVAGPVVYFAARKRPSGREVWWGALAALVPLIGVILFFATRPRQPPPAIGAWNPWIVCPWCQAPRGLTADPCPRCGQLLPPGAVPQNGAPAAIGPPVGYVPSSPMPGYAPPASATSRGERPRWKGTDVTGTQVLGAALFTFIVAGVALYVLLLPVLSNPATAEVEVVRLSGEPWFILLGLIIQDSILAAVALDQALFRRRLTLAEMGLTFERLRFSVPQQVAIGIAAGGATFALSSLSLQLLVDAVKAMGYDLGPSNPLVQPRISSLSDYSFWIVSAVVIAPIAEETFFRGYALSGFIKRGVPNAGLLATSSLFAVVHLDPLALGPLFAAGLVLGALRIQTGSLVAPLTAHATNNFIVVTLTLLGM